MGDKNPYNINKVEQKYGQPTQENPSIINVTPSFKFHLGKQGQPQDNNKK